MYYLKKNLQLGVVLILSVLLISCSSDDDNKSPDPDPDLGFVNLSLGGDLEGEKSGVADFYHSDETSPITWELTFHDAQPETYSLTIGLSSYEELSRPNPGTYQIGHEVNSTSVFFGIYTDIPDGNMGELVEYDTFDSGGTLTIETSDENWVTGSFSFTAFSRDGNFNPNGTVHVSGDFKAHKRITGSDL